nr:DUF1707 domain-containing protein [Nocardioides lijunqiniae]
MRVVVGAAGGEEGRGGEESGEAEVGHERSFPRRWSRNYRSGRVAGRGGVTPVDNVTRVVERDGSGGPGGTTVLSVDPVSDSERNAAIKAVEAALADGRIVQADRDHRVMQLRGAQTASEVRMVVHDLAYRDQPGTTQTPSTTPATGAPTSWPTYEAPATPVSTNPYGPPQGTAATAKQLFGTRKSSGGQGCAIVFFVVIFVVVGSVILGVFSAISDDPFESDPFGSDTFSEGVGPDGAPEEGRPSLFRPADFDALRDAIEAETGATTVFRAVLYPTYASVAVPAQATGPRELSYYYDGDLDTDPSPGRSSFQRFDLARIDPSVIAPLVRRARNNLVEDPTSVYVILQKPDEFGAADAWISVYASNDFQESGYLEADLTGKVVNRYVSE